MRLTTRLSLAAAIAVIATTAACSSDNSRPPTGPPATPGTLAQHFDTLYAQAKASSNSDANYNARVELLSDLELAAAFGAAPTAVTVTTSAGTESWKAFVFEEVLNTGGVPSDSGYIMIAYRDSLVRTALLTGVRGNGASLGGRLLVNDTVVVVASANSGLASLISTGSACATPIAGLVNPIIATAQSATCLTAVIQAAHSSTFPAKAGVDAAYTQLSFASQSFAGERFFDPPTAGAQIRLASLLRRQLEANH